MTQLAVITCCERTYAMANDDDKDSFVSENVEKHMNAEYRNIEPGTFDKRWMCEDCVTYKKNGYVIFPSICDREESFSQESHPGR